MFSLFETAIGAGNMGSDFFRVYQCIARPAAATRNFPCTVKKNVFHHVSCA